MRSTCLGLLVAATLSITTLACSGDDDSGQRADTESIDASSSGNGNGATGTTDQSNKGGNADHPSSGSAGNGGVLGTARADLPTNGGASTTVPIRIDVTRLERHGDLVELTVQLTNESRADADDSDAEYMLSNQFGDDTNHYDASAVGLVDGDGQKLYLPAFDSENVCLCSNDFGGVFVEPGATRTIDATFGGVPDDLDKVDVRVPTFPTIAGVTIQ
jgi:hypothetical protein